MRHDRDRIMTADRKSDADNCIDYVEFAVADIPRSKSFYGGAFGWTFKDYGPEYCEFSDGRFTGGFTVGTATPGGALIILYADDLARAEANVAAAGGRIVRPAYAFPGGRRFHFADLDGYELAVWSKR